MLPDGQQITKDKEKGGLSEKQWAYVQGLIERLSELILTYDISSFDAESITNIMEVMFSCKPENLDIVKPLIEYIETCVEPAMGKYIENHPARGRIVGT